MTRIIKDAILAGGEEKGNDLCARGLCKLSGLPGYMEWLAERQPGAYAALVGRVLPMQIIEVPPDTRYRSIEELERALSEAGVPAEVVRPMLEYYSPDKLLEQPVVDVPPEEQ